MNAKRQRREGAAQLLHESRLASNVKAGFPRFFPPWKKGLIDQSEGHLRHDICLCQHRRAALDEDIESGYFFRSERSVFRFSTSSCRSGDLGVSRQAGVSANRASLTMCLKAFFPINPWPMWSWRSTLESRSVFESFR